MLSYTHISHLQCCVWYQRETTIEIVLENFILYLNFPQFNDLYLYTLISTTEENQTQVKMIDKNPIRIFSCWPKTYTTCNMIHARLFCVFCIDQNCIWWMPSLMYIVVQVQMIYPRQNKKLNSNKALCLCNILRKLLSTIYFGTL